MKKTAVLIVGAGPTGLVAALWLTQSGVPVRIIDKVAAPGSTSRALVVHARTLEFYRQMGLVDEVEKNGFKFTAANLWISGKQAAHVSLGDIGKGLSAYPYMTIYPQDEHEKFLIDRLNRLGVPVERSTELIAFEQSEYVLSKLKHSDGSEETCKSIFLLGCDGAHSKVRDLLQVGFSGSTYSQLFYVADVEADGVVANGELHVAIDEVDFLAAFPLKGKKHARLIGTIIPQSAKQHEQLTWNDVSPNALDRLKINVRKVNWFSTYHVHHRMADRFQVEKVFLLGDAAHIHSPVGGQGMNTGIGDAVNLAWKLTEVLQKRSKSEILQTYELERMAFARRLVATTDQAFTMVSSPGPMAKQIRTQLVPRILPVLTKLKSFRRFLFRSVSQIAVQYRKSPLSEGFSGSLHAGDRLPWIQFIDSSNRKNDNYSALEKRVWQLHVYGELSQDVIECCHRWKLKSVVFPWHRSMGASGLEKDVIYLVRADGHIGLIDSKAKSENIDSYLNSKAFRISSDENLKTFQKAREHILHSLDH